MKRKVILILSFGLWIFSLIFYIVNNIIMNDRNSNDIHEESFSISGQVGNPLDTPE